MLHKLYLPCPRRLCPDCTVETLHPLVNSKEMLSHDDNEPMTMRPLDNVDTDGGFGNKFASTPMTNVGE